MMLARPRCSLSFGLGAQRVEHDDRLLHAERGVDELGAVRVETGHVADALREPLDRLEHGVEAVVGEQLSVAVAEHFGVSAARGERVP